MTATRGERRAVERFPIRMSLRYRLKRNQQEPALEASGHVVDISSTGVLISPSPNRLPGSVLVLSIDWPAYRDDAPPIKLSVVGLVVRSDDRGTAVSILRHEFELGEDKPAPDELAPSEAPEAGTAAGEEPQAC